MSPSIDSELDGDRAAERLYEVLRQLSPKCRAAVVLQYRDSLSYREIGSGLVSGRGDRIRTCGPHVPNVVRYQTAPLPAAWQRL